MSFKYIADKWGRDRDLPERAHHLSMMRRLLNGTFYSVLRHQFDEERAGNDEYVPLRDRQPSVHVGTNLIRTVVEDSVFMLFGERQFPEVDTSNATARQVIADLIKETKLGQVMRDAAFRGSVGSIAVRIHLSKNGRVHYKVFDTEFLTPIWNDDEPDVLDAVIQKYKIKGIDLHRQGYPIKVEDRKADFWFQRIWDDLAEWWFVPWKVSDDTEDAPHTPEIDLKRTVEHRLGFCPMRWGRNLHGGDDIDGGCTFRPVVDTCIEMDKQMSQLGRGLKYTQDPLLLIKEPPVEQVFGSNGMEEVTLPNGQVSYVRAPNSALVINSAEGGDAKFLEINGTAANAVIEYYETLKKNVIETVHGNRISPENIGGGARGAMALQMVNASLVMLADTLRATYGEDLLLGLIAQFQKLVAARPGQVRVNGKVVPAEVAKADDLSLRWKDFYAPTPQDLLNTAQALAHQIKAGFTSRYTAIKAIMADYDIESADAEKALIEAEQTLELERAKELAASGAKAQPAAD